MWHVEANCQTLKLPRGSSSREGLPIENRSAYCGLERTCDGGHRLYDARNEGGLHFADCIVDRDAPTFVEDFNAEDASRAHGAHLVRTTERDIERKRLVGVPRGCNLLILSGRCDDRVERINR